MAMALGPSETSCLATWQAGFATAPVDFCKLQIWRQPSGRFSFSIAISRMSIPSSSERVRWLRRADSKVRAAAYKDPASGSSSSSTRVIAVLRMSSRRARCRQRGSSRSDNHKASSGGISAIIRSSRPGSCIRPTLAAHHRHGRPAESSAWPKDYWDQTRWALHPHRQAVGATRA